MITMKIGMITGAMNTGSQTHTIVMSIGSIILMAIIVSIMSGIIPGGGIGIGGVATGATTLTGTSSVPVSILSGMRMDAGGGDQGMGDGCGINCHILTQSSDIRQGHME